MNCMTYVGYVGYVGYVAAYYLYGVGRGMTWRDGPVRGMASGIAAECMIGSQLTNKTPNHRSRPVVAYGQAGL